MKTIPFHTQDIVIHVSSTNYAPILDTDINLDTFYKMSNDSRFNLFETEDNELLYEAKNGDFIQGHEVI
jgi:hypothetical protein